MFFPSLYQAKPLAMPMPWYMITHLAISPSMQGETAGELLNFCPKGGLSFDTLRNVPKHDCKAVIVHVQVPASHIQPLPIS